MCVLGIPFTSRFLACRDVQRLARGVRPCPRLTAPGLVYRPLDQARRLTVDTEFRSLGCYNAYLDELEHGSGVMESFWGPGPLYSDSLTTQVRHHVALPWEFEATAPNDGSLPLVFDLVCRRSTWQRTFRGKKWDKVQTGLAQKPS